MATFCIPKNIFEPQEFLDMLTCNIGKGIMNDPVTLPCQHGFCRKCIEAALAIKEVCPVCNRSVSLRAITPQPSIVELINMSIVKCPKCDWNGAYQSYVNHEKNCSPTSIDCPAGCGVKILKTMANDHMTTCKFRRVICEQCKKQVYYRELIDHEDTCPNVLVDCPSGCGKKFTISEREAHLKLCNKTKPSCDYLFCGCSFNDGNDKSKAEEHKKEMVPEHLMMLGTLMDKLCAKVDVLEHVSILKPGEGQKAIQFLEVNWSNGSKSIHGEIDGWSFYLSDRMISGNFVARIKICNLGLNDPNSWKIALGLFSSKEYKVGTWDKYQNGYGYILGTGTKIHVKGAQLYGEKYGVGDIISIEYANGDITFIRNERSQGVAYKGINGPFYLAVAMSKIGHQVEIVDVRQTD